MKRSSLLLRALLLGAVGAGSLVLACSTSSGGDASTAASDGGLMDRTHLDAPFHPDASCEVTIETPELLASPHVVEGTVVSYSSNPPSSGPHYPIWANFQEFTVPFDDGYLVHSLEHGAVALLYKCDDAGCPDVVAAFRKIRDALPTDPLCDPSIRVRVVIAPYPKMDVPVAAVAWGWTYKAQCVDVPTLTQFATDHYGQGPEQLCAPGRTF